MRTKVILEWIYSIDKIAKVYRGDEVASIFKKLNERTVTNVFEPVKQLFDELDKNGLNAIIEQTKRFDKFSLTSENLRIKQEEIDLQATRLTPNQKNAINASFERVFSFQQKIAQALIPILEEDSEKKTMLVPKPLNAVGIWIPGGLAPLP